jgi:hypothetical protein
MDEYETKYKIISIIKTLKSPLDYFRVAEELGDLFLINNKEFIREIALLVAKKESADIIEKRLNHLAFLEMVDGQMQ